MHLFIHLNSCNNSLIVIIRKIHSTICRIFERDLAKTFQTKNQFLMCCASKFHSLREKFIRKLNTRFLITFKHNMFQKFSFLIISKHILFFFESNIIFSFSMLSIRLFVCFFSFLCTFRDLVAISF